MGYIQMNSPKLEHFSRSDIVKQYVRCVEQTNWHDWKGDIQFIYDFYCLLSVNFIPYIVAVVSTTVFNYNGSNMRKWYVCVINLASMIIMVFIHYNGIIDTTITCYN